MKLRGKGGLGGETDLFLHHGSDRTTEGRVRCMGTWDAIGHHPLECVVARGV